MEWTRCPSTRFAPKAGEHSIDLRTTFDPAAIRFQVDVRAVQALLTNLLENALDACRAEPTRERHVIEFEVRDEREEVLYRIGDDRPQRIASQHDGSIDVVSQLGRGTTFTVRLPKHATKRKEKSGEKRDTPSAAETPPTSH